MLPNAFPPAIPDDIPDDIPDEVPPVIPHDIPPLEDNDALMEEVHNVSMQVWQMLRCLHDDGLVEDRPVSTSHKPYFTPRFEDFYASAGAVILYRMGHSIRAPLPPKNIMDAEGRLANWHILSKHLLDMSICISIAIQKASPDRYEYLFEIIRDLINKIDEFPDKIADICRVDTTTYLRQILHALDTGSPIRDIPGPPFQYERDVVVEDLFLLQN